VNKAMAFIIRDFRIESGNKWVFLMEIMGSLLPIFVFFYISKSLVAVESPQLNVYGGKYFPYVLLGLAFSQYFLAISRSIGTSIRRQQTGGMLEAIMSARTHPGIVIMLTPIYAFLSKSIHLFAVVAIGIVFMGLDFSNVNISSVVVVAAISLTCFSALGILVAAATVEFKKGEHFEWFFITSANVLGGVFFPVEALPEWLKTVSRVVPMTYSLDALRLAILQGFPLTYLGKQIFPLLALTIFLVPISLFLFTLSIERARRDGSLCHY
jgi:ABC-2 type transport system permease protein